MKILIIECDAEELRANRTVLDNITEALSGFTRSFAGFDLTPEQAADALKQMNNDRDDLEEESDEN